MSQIEDSGDPQTAKHCSSAFDRNIGQGPGAIDKPRAHRGLGGVACITADIADIDDPGNNDKRWFRDYVCHDVVWKLDADVRGKQFLQIEIRLRDRDILKP